MNARTLLVAFLLTACADGSGDGTDAPTDDDTLIGDTDVDSDVAAVTCSSGTYWTQGDRESPLMHPGRACFTCHSERREGPTHGVAGTVYRTAHEEKDCNGEEDVTVEIVGDDGAVTTYTTNAAGNFVSSFRDTIVFPVTARVVVGDEVREMVTPQMSGDCNSCHTAQGEQGAPGRIVVP